MSRTLYPRAYGKQKPSFKFEPETAPQGSFALWSERTLKTSAAEVKPVFFASGHDAGASSWPVFAGDTLNIGGSGSTPTTSAGSPFFGQNAVKFVGGKGYEDTTDTTTADLPNGHDIVVECLFKAPDNPPAAADILLSKRETGGVGVGYALWLDSALRLNLSIIGTSTKTMTAGTACVSGTWYHSMGFVNQSENSTNGGAIYLNSLLVASTNMNGAGNTTCPTRPVQAGFQDFSSFKSNSTIESIALWTGPSILAEGADGPARWQIIATERMSLAAGVLPKGKGTITPQSFGGNSTRVLDVCNDSGVVKYYSVGPYWPRVSRRADASSNNIKGYLSEMSHQNLITYSNNPAQTSAWAYTTGLSSIVQNIAGPWDFQNMWTLTEDSGNSRHYVGMATSITNTYNYCASCVVKANTRTIVEIDISGSQYVRFNLATGAIIDNPPVGTAATTNRKAYIRSLGNGWYKIAFAFTAAVSTGVVVGFGLCDGSGNLTYVGDGSSSAYFGMFQFETKSSTSILRDTSYIDTTTVAITRAADNLSFKIDDGNLGGIGSNKKGRAMVRVLLPNWGPVGVSPYIFQLSDGTSATDRILCAVATSSTDQIQYYCVATGGTAKNVLGSSDIVDNNITTVEVSWSDRGFNGVRVDGLLEGSATTVSADIPDDLDILTVGYTNVGAGFELGGIISSLKLYSSTRK